MKTKNAMQFIARITINHELIYSPDNWLTLNKFTKRERKRSICMFSSFDHLTFFRRRSCVLYRKSNYIAFRHSAQNMQTFITSAKIVGCVSKSRSSCASLGVDRYRCSLEICFVAIKKHSFLNAFHYRMTHILNNMVWCFFFSFRF